MIPGENSSSYLAFNIFTRVFEKRARVQVSDTLDSPDQVEGREGVKWEFRSAWNVGWENGFMHWHCEWDWK